MTFLRLQHHIWLLKGQTDFTFFKVMHTHRLPCNRLCKWKKNNNFLTTKVVCECRSYRSMLNIFSQTQNKKKHLHIVAISIKKFQDKLVHLCLCPLCSQCCEYVPIVCSTCNHHTLFSLWWSYHHSSAFKPSTELNNAGKNAALQISNGAPTTRTCSAKAAKSFIKQKPCTIKTHAVYD